MGVGEVVVGNPTVSADAREQSAEVSGYGLRVLDRQNAADKGS